MQLRDGDVVHVRMTIAKSEFGHFGVRLRVYSDGYADALSIARSAITHVEPKPIEVGAKVRWNMMGAGFEVRAVDGEVLLLKRDGRHYVVDIGHVERV